VKLGRAVRFDKADLKIGRGLYAHKDFSANFARQIMLACTRVSNGIVALSPHLGSMAFFQLTLVRFGWPSTQKRKACGQWPEVALRPILRPRAYQRLAGWLFNRCRLNVASLSARCSSMSQAVVISSLVRCETATSATAIFTLTSACFTSINAARYGFCHFGYFICSSSMGPPALSEGILARQRILDCAKVGKGKRTVSDLGVGSYAQGAVAEAGVAVGCVSTSRRYSHASEKATQSGEDRPRDRRVARIHFAVHESDNSKITSRIDDALKAIQKRQASTAPIDELERSAINNAVLAQVAPDIVKAYVICRRAPRVRSSTSSTQTACQPGRARVA
jgi:hypothetical protein